MTQAITNDQDSYVTNPARSSMIFHAVPGLYFYLRMLGTVFKAARKARKGYTDQDWIESSLEIIKHLETVDCRFFIDGKKNFINLEGPCVFVANHMSTLETFALASIIRPHRPLTFVVKESLVRYPVFKHVMQSRNPMVVSRKNPRQDFRVVMEEGQDRLSRGISVVIFPQARRTSRFDPEKFNSMGIKLARKAGVPVIPLALKTDAWSAGRLLKDFGKIRPERFIHFSFGPPLVVQGNGREEHQKVISFIRTNLEKWNRM
ncbi:lysophospholipid acyltransferase family protein [Desulfonatronovibrio hydrogenovorans]|uniref:lysophospholipid acyltransferase family protein n=1 Tax=Desulfonatronovibrio hydrogenovorans TaxID=53245 RepID=UPI0005551FE3|nr:lysophospholipid acyltransferase family protein [Desulfonatronovibrio hydrogenovorans]